jgi:predicted DNA-binding protein with PD1-like motif
MMLIGKTGKTVFSRFLEGEELLESIRSRAETSGIQAGFFVLIGTLKKASVGFYKEGKYKTMVFEGPLEIASCTGNIAVDDTGQVVAHAHIVVSDEKGRTFGGHLMKGSKVGATAELVMVEAEGVNLQKAYDEKTKLKLWKLA